jgi:hypothetical protein
MKDGGYIEVQYHKDSVWKNTAYDTLSFVNYMMFQCENLYSLNDTLFNSQPGFSGNTDWVTTKLQWIWTMPVKDYPPDTLRLRFHFASDNINTNKDGWMIDNLEMTSYNMGGSINENGVVKQLNCFPNPASDNTNIMLKNKPYEMYSLEIYNVYGQKAGSYENLSGENFSLVRNNLPSGLYFVVLKSCNGSVFSGKLVFR